MAIRRVKLEGVDIDIYDSRIVAIDSTLSTTSSNPIQNDSVAQEFEKVSYVGDTFDNVDEIPEEPVDPEDLFEFSANKVTSISASSTDTQYPSAKCVYTIVGNIETLLAAI